MKEELAERAVEEQEKAADRQAEPVDEHAVEVELPAGIQGLPDVLQTPVVWTGLRTQYVEFITDKVIHRILNEVVHEASRDVWPGTVQVKEWKSGEEFSLPRNLSVHHMDEPFRISFVVENSGDVLPLQQCTDAEFEKSDSVSSTAWLREPWSLVGVWEPTPVSRQLDAVLERYLFHETIDAGEAVTGPLHRFVRMVMEPYPE